MNGSSGYPNLTLEKMVIYDMIVGQYDPESKMDILRFWRDRGVGYEEEKDAKEIEYE